jgi:aminopeptidase N
MKKTVLLVATYFLFLTNACSQVLNNKQEATRQDVLRGTLTKERTGWNVLKYDITVTPDFVTKSLQGKNKIVFFDSGSYTMQIDLQQPMEIDSAVIKNEKIIFKREGNVFWFYLLDSAKKYKIKPGIKELTIFFHGVPRPAVNAPWDGGWIWKKDEKGRPWISVACQGLGASVWYPCKDHQSDEPDNGASITINIPDTLVAIANGKLKNKLIKNGLASYTWEVKNPINNYNIVPYIGKYVNYTETFNGEKGKLNCSYWVLDYNLEKAKKQFEQVKPMLKAFEYWFGPYPFYEDDYKLVESPHLGMEHQSAVAYGNKFKNGYLGSDLSGTGQGLKWDFIIVHESGHEWFGNNITTKDIADMWVHEGFTNYSETLFMEYNFTKQDAYEYVRGLRNKIQNKKPIIGEYGINQEGSGDMYYKGANMLHTIRQVICDDKKFRNILRGLNKKFYHQTVTTKQVEDYMIQQSGKDLTKIFEQYLRHTKIPMLKLDVDGDVLKYKWDDCIEGFNMPVKLTNGQWLLPVSDWQELKMDLKSTKDIDADPNFYINVKKDD